MKIFKFGGASVRDSEGIKNLASIVSREEGDLVVVVSAFGKTTNALESILKMWLEGDEGYLEKLEGLFQYHLDIIYRLFPTGNMARKRLVNSLGLLREYLGVGKKVSYDNDYDQIVSYGEIWSTTIISEYLNHKGIIAQWVDIRRILVTDDNYREANVLWTESSVRIRSRIDFKDKRLYITQGFIGGTITGETTTMGREGSDYTAAVIANILDADCVVVWKDVPGLLNADPKWIPEAEKLVEISYREAVEMAFSGAKIIHPKTIKPLHNKNIPLYIKSFLESDERGTLVTSKPRLERVIPIFIKKESQILISIVPKDLSFAMDLNLGKIFRIFHDYGIKPNLVQASAVSINISVDHEKERIEKVCLLLKEEFEIHYNDKVELVTVRHYSVTAIEKITADREVLLEQKTRNMARFIVR